MNNKLLKIAIFLVIFMIGLKNVYAEPAWPKEFTYGDFRYTIEGFRIKVFEINQEPQSTNNTDNQSNNQTVNNILNNQTTTSGENKQQTNVIPQDLLNYIDDHPTKIIPLSGEEFTFNPTYKNDKLYQSNTLFVGLNLSVTKEKIEALLNQEISSASNTKQYITELVVDYKLNAYPEKYKKLYNVNFTRDFMKLIMNEDISTLFSTDSSGNTTNQNQWSRFEEINTTQTISQVINVFPITYDTEKNESKLIFGTKCSSEEVDMTNYLNYLAMLENENDVNPQLILFHSVEDIDSLITAFKDTSIEEQITSIEENNETEEKDNQVVKVDNTSANIEKYIYYGSIGLLILGFILIISVIIKNKKENHYLY